MIVHLIHIHVTVESEGKFVAENRFKCSILSILIKSRFCFINTRTNSEHTGYNSDLCEREL